MTTLADQSTMPDFPWWVWAAAAALAIAWFAVAWVREGRNLDHALNSFRDTPPVWDGLTEGLAACHSTGPRGGHMYVNAGGTTWQCVRCGDTVPRKSKERSA